MSSRHRTRPHRAMMAYELRYIAVFLYCVTAAAHREMMAGLLPAHGTASR